ncbi:MAG: hypothetical protein KC547_18600 [Anaerolineae bacterium]|nr:hypothetical protein [Anaerolineae bacterium]MCA9909245.1 hypothetical protein [Anaerolineae bacterium]
MTSLQQEQNDYFRLILMTVVGQAYAAAGFALEEKPTQWAGGQFRFFKQLNKELYAFIAYQHLPYPEPQPSRFRVTLARTDKLNPALSSRHPKFDRRTLSVLVVEDFGVNILPMADYWWEYRTTEELGRALAEAGHLVAGYGIPWLAGELTPPERQTAESAT